MGDGVESKDYANAGRDVEVRKDRQSLQTGTIKHTVASFLGCCSQLYRLNGLNNLHYYLSIERNRLIPIGLLLLYVYGEVLHNIYDCVEVGGQLF